ncbi:hypothetical protein NECAME_15516 [Necator americanus]|uniref:Uncharacterized protein n=1 Tax=Necator americanus TaxID=51031 RepID=W2SHH8_NECAM|nr:hypothetical protein NECAME_15516 [Necator americanus]ETN69104.1 hypothetical protein NECAME_15516 [Necator americanus]
MGNSSTDDRIRAATVSETETKSWEHQKNVSHQYTTNRLSVRKIQNSFDFWIWEDFLCFLEELSNFGSRKLKVPSISGTGKIFVFKKNINQVARKSIRSIMNVLKLGYDNLKLTIADELMDIA